MEKKKAIWYFDFISPFAYFQHEMMGPIEAIADVERKPILFAALLSNWGHKGPAEIPSKRIFTYEFALWFAHKHGIPYKIPPSHPFNPLAALRLSLLCDNRPEAVARIFRHIWAEGNDPTDPESFARLAVSLGVDDPKVALSQPHVKEALRSNSEEAVERNLFGVPTFVVDERLFWGNDGSQMVVDFLNDDLLFSSPEMNRANNLPEGIRRPGA